MNTPSPYFLAFNPSVGFNHFKFFFCFEVIHFPKEHSFHPHTSKSTSFSTAVWLLHCCRALNWSPFDGYPKLGPAHSTQPAEWHIPRGLPAPGSCQSRCLNAFKPTLSWHLISLCGANWDLLLSQRDVKVKALTAVTTSAGSLGSLPAKELLCFKASVSLALLPTSFSSCATEK